MLEILLYAVGGLVLFALVVFFLRRKKKAEQDSNIYPLF